MSRSSSTRSTRIRHGELRSSSSASGHSRHINLHNEQKRERATRTGTVHVRITVSFPNASIIQNPRCPLKPTNAAAPAASNDALKARRLQHKPAAAALLLHQHAHHSNPRETGMFIKRIASPHTHRHPRSQSLTRKRNIMNPYHRDTDTPT